jgi:hypothetical protein
MNLPQSENLTALIAILRAAYLTGDRPLERQTRRQLRDCYGITVSIERPKTPGHTQRLNPKGGERATP